MPDELIADCWLGIITLFSVSYAIYNIKCVHSIWVQRKEQYISQRRPIMLVAYCVLASIYLLCFIPIINVHIITSRSQDDQVFDAVYFVIEAIYGTVFPTFINIIAIRVWLLYFEHKFAMATVDRIWRKVINPGEKDFFLRSKATLGNHYYLSQKLFIFWVFKITLLLTMIFSFLPDPFHSRMDELVFFTFRICIIVPTLFFILAIYNKVNGLHDEFDIKNEMRWLARLISFLIVAGLTALFILLFTDLPIYHLDLLVYTNDVFFYVGSCYLQTRWVLKKYHRKREKEATQRSKGRQSQLSLTMVDVLREQNAFEAFVRHCVNELSVESLLFLVEVAQYKATLSSYDVPEPASQFQSLNVQKVNIRHVLLDHWMTVNQTDVAGGRDSPDPLRVRDASASPKIPTPAIHPNGASDWFVPWPQQDCSADDHVIKRSRSKHGAFYQFQLFQQSILGRKWLPISWHTHAILNDNTSDSPAKSIEEEQPAACQSPSDYEPELAMTESIRNHRVSPPQLQPFNTMVVIDGQKVFVPSTSSKKSALSEPDTTNPERSETDEQRHPKTARANTPSAHSAVSHQWIREYCWFLYEKYVKEDSDLVINISWETRDFLATFAALSDDEAFTYIVEHSGGEEDARRELPAGIDQDLLINTYLYHLFDAAFEEVWALLQSDSFIRFSMTPAYRKLSAPLNQDGVEVVFDVLKTNNLVR